MNPTASNILDVYRNASFDAFSLGFDWYPDAQEFARSLDTRFHRSAGVIAALSPMNEWNNNKRKAAMLYRNNGVVQWNGKSNGLGLAANVHKAVRIYNGEDALDVLGGDKVRAFYLAIVEPTNPDSTPVIDRHAFDIAVGERTNDKARGMLSRKGMYEAFADSYREAAHRIGIGVHQVQAITWTAWKQQHGIYA